MFIYWKPISAKWASLSPAKWVVLRHNFAAAAAKSLQLCPTLCDSIDGSPPGSPVPGILQARTLEWVAISFSNAWKWKVKVKLLSPVQPSATPWTAAYQAPPPMGFSRQEYWSGLPLPSPIILLGMSKYSHTFAIYFWTTLLLFKLNSNVNQIGQIFYFSLCWCAECLLEAK